MGGIIPAFHDLDRVAHRRRTKVWHPLLDFHTMIATRRHEEKRHMREKFNREAARRVQLLASQSQCESD